MISGFQPGIRDFIFSSGQGLEFSILELGLFWAGSYGELGGLFAVVGLLGPMVTFRLLTAAGY